MKARLQFSKMGSMRFIGHLDVMRYFQKAFRRAGIAISYSQGYSPHQLMSFASPLGIGLSSEAEYLDIILDDSEQTADFLPRINAVMNEEITVSGFSILSKDARPSMAALAACDYIIAGKPGKNTFLGDAVRRRDILSRFCQRDSVSVVKKTKRSEKRVDIKENIYCITDVKEEFEGFIKKEVSSFLEDAGYIPFFYCELTAGSIVNIKPELVIQALCEQEAEEYSACMFQIHRLEMYADRNAEKGIVHTMCSVPPCDLVPLSEYQKRERGQQRGAE